MKNKSKAENAFFGSGIMADAVLTAENGKIIAHGIFTSFLAWAYPCRRKCDAIITLFNPPQRGVEIIMSYRRKGSNYIKIGRFDREKDKKDLLGTTIQVPVQFRFERAGDYELKFVIKGTRTSLIIPFKLNTKEWPVFSEEEKEFVKSNPNYISNIHTNVSCDNAKCNHRYVFEESVTEESKIVGGVHRFPESGIFKCEECGKKLFLKDLQGQIRASLKELLQLNMGRQG